MKRACMTGKLTARLMSARRYMRNSLLTLSGSAQRWIESLQSGRNPANTSSAKADSTELPGLVKPPCASTRGYLVATGPGICCWIPSSNPEPTQQRKRC